MSDELWPDSLRVGDTIEYNGNSYEVVGTAPGKATVERVDDSSVQADLFRWAFSDTVGMEIEHSIEQEQFGKMVTRNNE